MVSNIITGLDIGTTTTTVAMGEIGEQNNVEIIGIGQAPSEGLRRGTVVNIDLVLKSITHAIEDAERMAGQEVEEVVVGISGEQIKGINSRGVVAISGKGKHIGKEITQDDIERVIEAAQAVAIPMDRETLHVIPQQYIVDGQTGIRNPLGMIGVRLEAEGHIITGSVSSAQNLIKAVNRAGFRVSGLVLKSIAAATTVLTKDEEELGALLIDIGGGTTDILLCIERAPHYSSVLTIGGIDITSDLSIMLKAPINTAEQLKKDIGSYMMQPGVKEEPILIGGVGGRPAISVGRKDIVNIIAPRATEIFQLVRQRIQESELLNRLGGGIVLTGGGALLTGMIDAAQDTFGVSARLGQPANYGGVVDQYRDPVFATAVGLVRYTARLHNAKGGSARSEGSGKLFPNVRRWLRNFFE